MQNRNIQNTDIQNKCRQVYVEFWGRRNGSIGKRQRCSVIVPIYNNKSLPENYDYILSSLYKDYEHINHNLLYRELS
jgi:hypothetical protein